MREKTEPPEPTAPSSEQQKPRKSIPLLPAERPTPGTDQYATLTTEARRLASDLSPRSRDGVEMVIRQHDFDSLSKIVRGLREIDALRRTPPPAVG